LKTIGKRVTVYDVYDRAKTGQKVAENDWDYKIVPQAATALKKKYDVKIDKTKMIPEDPKLIDSLWQAGLEMLETTGIYCIDTGRVVKYTRDEILQAIAGAPDSFIYGEGKEAINVVPRAHSDSKAPIIQGGPTGSPCSEELFLPIHQAYAQEPLVDTIVDGVLQTVMGKDPVPNSPWEIMAVRSEALFVRDAQCRAGRSGMGL
jgi:methylamine--corrinoid protein Co-methyltransferase